MDVVAGAVVNGLARHVRLLGDVAVRKDVSQLISSWIIRRSRASTLRYGLAPAK